MESKIVKGPGGTSFVGTDAVALYRAAVIAQGLRMYSATKTIPSRAWTPTAMLRAAEKITGRTYKRGQYLTAATDVQAWVNAMSAALPKEDHNG